MLIGAVRGGQLGEPQGGGRQRWARRLDGLATALRKQLADAETEDAEGAAVLRIERPSGKRALALTLLRAEGTDPGLPEHPVLYRIGRWAEAPGSVGVDGASVTVNQGGSAPRLFTEAAVDGSRVSAWFHDASARRLIVKVVP